MQVAILEPDRQVFVRGKAHIRLLPPPTATIRKDQLMVLELLSKELNIRAMLRDSANPNTNIEISCLPSFVRPTRNDICKYYLILASCRIYLTWLTPPSCECIEASTDCGLL